MSLTVFTCTRSSPMLFCPLTKHQAAGWRSRQRRKIRGIVKKKENGGGRWGRTPRPQSTMSYLVLCPPCHYLLHMDMETVHSCFLASRGNVKKWKFISLTLTQVLGVKYNKKVKWHSKRLHGDLKNVRFCRHEMHFQPLNGQEVKAVRYLLHLIQQLMMCSVPPWNKMLLQCAVR